ncbi:MAG TPA: DUF302 domain-containing protein [Thiobacillaceae bacterium]|nr:DUF302 domain-containing protein [Thiobacillaceae bacterium]
MMRTLWITLACFFSLSAFAATPPAPTPEEAAPQGWIGVTPTPYGPILVQEGLPPPYRDYQMNRILSPEERKRWWEETTPAMAGVMQMDAREAMNHFAVKYQAKAGVSFDEAVQSMMLRANQVNLKHVGTNPLWKEFRAALNDPDAPRVEVFSFCDIAVARDLLKVIPEMVVFLPCRIAVMEDADKNVWLLTMDWDVMWLDLAGKHLGITPELRKGAMEIREKLDDVMRAGANGEL